MPATLSTPAAAPSIVHRLRANLERHDLFPAGQTASRRWSIGCVSLEVTQRCNLDCTLCYLSEHAEATRDPPLAELLVRIDEIAAMFGPNTDIQISGGDPTLRPIADLVAIVRRIRALGMRSSLFTNGILASRALLARLAREGLNDVAFHVDMTQQRKGFDSESDLDRLRSEYIDRARGLGLQVFFNTTVFSGNLHEVAHLVRFFARHVDVVRFASFQLGADTGRGVTRNRGAAVNQESVIAQIRRGAGVDLSFDTFLAGHPRCNRAAMALVAGGRFVDLLAERDLAIEVMNRTTGIVANRDRPFRTAAAFALAVLRQPDLVMQSIGWTLRAVWRLRAGLAPGRGPSGKLTFFLHSFMDASALEQERLDTCVFMAATPQGFMSMCEFNARRDEILLQPRVLPDGSTWNPIGNHVRRPDVPAERVYPIKFLKGRPRARALQERQSASRAAGR